jgi:NAD-dependent dihydropyrimidine dehydrogenase PreA subunit
MTLATAAASAAQCKGEPGRVAPQIDRNKCEGKADCVRVCPYGVFEMGTLAAEQRASLSLLGRLKSWAHGYRQAFVVKPADCHACNLCVAACPETAIQLVPLRS